MGTSLTKKINEKRRENKDILDWFFARKLFEKDTILDEKQPLSGQDFKNYKRRILQKAANESEKLNITSKKLLELACEDSNLRHSAFLSYFYKRDVFGKHQIEAIENILNDFRTKEIKINYSKVSLVLNSNGSLYERNLKNERDFLNETKPISHLITFTYKTSFTSLYIMNRYCTKYNSSYNTSFFELKYMIEFSRRNRNKNVKFLYLLDGPYFERRNIYPESNDKVIITNLDSLKSEIAKIVNELKDKAENND